MHEASSNPVQTRVRTVSGVRRLGVVSAGGNIAGVPAPELANLLAAVASQRDRQAFAMLFGHFGPRLKTFFMRGALPAVVAEELVQETMLSVWRKAAYFDAAKAGVTTWVFTIARNMRIDHLRRQKNPLSLPPDPEEAPPSLEDVLLGAERDLRVREALAGLSDEQRTIIRLAYYAEKSQTEIAAELGIPLGTVKSRTRLAMSRLRALLEEKE